MLSGFFKIVFGIVAACALLLLAASANAAGALGGASFLTGPLLILFVGGAALVLYSRGRRRIAAETQSVIAARRRTEDAGFRLFNGVGAQILLDDTTMVIRRYGADSFLIHGAKGDKRIPIASITAVQFREPGRQTSGYIQFSMLGGVESTGGIWQASKDENTMLFTPAQRDDIADLCDLVEKKMAARHAPAAVPGMNSVADELAKLADLCDRGILDAAEFAEQKAAVLRRAV